MTLNSKLTHADMCLASGHGRKSIVCRCLKQEPSLVQSKVDVAWIYGVRRPARLPVQ